MRTENVMYFTEKEEEFANLLIEIGTKRNVAKVLVFLANTPEADIPGYREGHGSPPARSQHRHALPDRTELDHQQGEQGRK